ncbi:MAG TPA: hypothetical protein VL282_01860, partial [Tepidisphaeraceae bacterium]|nr:hypothetical protein [Tepidisphaeraceae bacterium]
MFDARTEVPAQSRLATGIKSLVQDDDPDNLMASKQSQPDRPVSFDALMRAVALLRALPCDWWIAGGWAIDLFLGRVTRSHGDLEIGIWRDDQAKLRAAFPNRIWHKAVDHGWVPWPSDDRIELPVFQLKALDESAGDEIEFFLNDRDTSGNFICRRDDRVRLPII